MAVTAVAWGPPASRSARGAGGGHRHGVRSLDTPAVADSTDPAQRPGLEYPPALGRARVCACDETEKAKKKSHTHTYTYTQKKKGVSSPLATLATRGGAPEGGRRPPRGSTRGALAAREPCVPTSSDLGLLPSLHRLARTLGTRVTGSHRGGARVRGAFARGGPSALGSGVSRGWGLWRGQ